MFYTIVAYFGPERKGESMKKAILIGLVILLASVYGSWNLALVLGILAVLFLIGRAIVPSRHRINKISKWHLQEQPIPHGYQIFEERLQVAGLAHRRAVVARFICGKHLRLELIREASNKHDPNAIMVFGCTDGIQNSKRFHLGYVPREVAKAIVGGGFWGRVMPRLLYTYLGDTGYVDVLFQILGPKGRKKAYESIRGNR